jgi:molybdate transport system permease protein
MTLLSEVDMTAVMLTLELAMMTTALLILLGTPIAWWLSQTHSRLKPLATAIVALPLVLPPSVIGFYLLVGLGPNGPVGKFTQWIGFGLLPFTFGGLLVGSCLYSMPFVVQPLQNAFEAINERMYEAAYTLRAGPWDTFFNVAVPLAKPGFLTAVVMGFAHTIGEFGVVLMIGGNIPGRTRVISVQLYDHVEALEYSHAHRLAALMLIFSLVVLYLLYRLNPTGKSRQVQ